MDYRRINEQSRAAQILKRGHLSASSQLENGSAASRAERDLFARCRDGDQLAREQLVERFMPLARKLAHRYKRASEPLDDLLQVASIGLLKAIDGFDAGRHVAFSSYAVPTILGELKRHFRDRTWAVRPPRDLLELSLKVDRAVGELSDKLHRQPSVAEIATAVGAGDEAVLEALQAGRAYNAMSFDAPRGTSTTDEPAAVTLGDALGVDEHGFDRAEERATLDTLLVAISSRERAVLRMRFEQDMTQAEIGALIGLSQMQISRIIRRALASLRDAAEAPHPSGV